MFCQWGPIVFYDLFTLFAFIFAAWYMDRSLGQVPSIPRKGLRLVIAASVFFYLYGGALIPYLYRLINNDPAPFYLASGRYFHSVFLAILLYLIVAFKLLRWPLGKGLDAYIIAALGASAFGRIGCFMEGCCQGKPTRLPWGLRFPNSPGATLHPTQLYMFFVETALVLFLIRFDRKKQVDGQTFWVGVWLYSIYRIAIETVRTNPIFLWGLTHAQAFSILSFVLSSWILIRQRRQKLPAFREAG